jgi:periplasmic protein TonB
MLRTLPFSILFHLAVLGVLALWGGYVPPTPLEPQRILRVQIARLPAVQPDPVSETPEPEPEPEPLVEPVPQTKPPDPVLPPKEVPKPIRPTQEDLPAPIPEPVRQPPREQRSETESDAGQTASPSGPSVSGTDVDFPFAWYLNRVEGIIARGWNPRQLGFRESASRSCVVHFMINRSGQVSQVTLVRGSGVSLFDREALRAVRSGRLPPLPPKFPHRALGVTFVFTLESGI